MTHTVITKETLSAIEFTEIDLDELLSRSKAYGTIAKHGDQTEHVPCEADRQFIEAVGKGL